MVVKHFEVYILPDDGPCSVHVRDENSNWAWVSLEEATHVADKYKARYNRHCIVHEVTGWSRKVVYDTIKGERECLE